MKSGGQDAKNTIPKKDLLCLPALTLLLLLIAIFSDSVVPYDPYAQNLSVALQPPSAVHFFGTGQIWKGLIFPGK